MTEVRRIDPESGFIREFNEVANRVKSLETRPSGNIVIRETLTTEDPETGVKTTIGQLPDGSWGFQPFIGDVTPPPVASMCFGTHVPGAFSVTWDGQFLDDAEKPRDFQHMNVMATQVDENSDPVQTVKVGVIRLAWEMIYVSTDICPIGTRWFFTLVSEDYNGNLAAAGLPTDTMTMESVVTDSGVNEAIEALQNAADAADLAAQTAQNAANAAQDDADAAAAAALAASNLAGSKGKVYTQSTAPSADYSGLWIDTAHNNIPRRYLGQRSALVSNLGGGAAIATRLTSLGWAVSAITSTPTLADASQYDLVAFDAGYAGLLSGPATRAAELFNRGISVFTTGNDTSWMPPLFTGASNRGNPKNSVQPVAGHPAGTGWSDYADADLILYLTGVNSAATVTGTTLVTSLGSNQPLNLVMEHTTNFARWAHIQTYNTPAAVSNSHLGWISNNWVAIQDQGVIAAATAAANAQTKADQAFSNAESAATAAGNAQISANSKNTIWYQDDQPAGTGHKIGDTWFDTNDNNKIRTWSGAVWQTTQDSWTAQQTADSKGITYTQSVTPPVSARLPQNLWNDTSLGEDKVVVKYWSTVAGAWTALADKAATEARTVADSKGETIYSATEPTVAQRLTQNLWIDTTGGLNISKRWNGSAWIVVADTRIASTATAVTAADAKAQNAYNEAIAKSTIYTQNVVPPVEARLPQTIWNDTTLGLDKVVVKYWSTTAGAWTPLADKEATEARVVADAKGETIYSDTEPSVAKRLPQNLWIDTTGGINLNKRWNGSGWITVVDARIPSTAAAVTAADAKAQTAVDDAATKSIIFTQSTTPPVSARLPQTLWNDTSLGLTNIVVKYWDGGQWAALADKTATDAAILAGNKSKVVYSNTAPTGADANVLTLWIDTTGGANTPKKWVSGTTWTAVTDKVASDALSTANSKGEVIYSDTAPAASKQLAQNLWIDTTGGINLHKRWLTNAWTPVPDSRIAQTVADISALSSTVSAVSAQADRSITTFYGTSTPTGAQEGDLWLSGVAGTPMKRYSAASTWLAYEDPNVQAAYEKAGDAQSAADAKVRTFAQDDQPTGMVPNDVGDLWIDTNDKNKLYRYNGATWDVLRDSTIADAQGTANTALTTASSAVTAAQGAQTTADGKNTSYYQDNQPTGGTYKVGDLWFDTNDNYKMRTFAGGSTWQLTQDSAGAIATASIDATSKAVSAIAAAAADATTKANQAKADAIAAATTADKISGKWIMSILDEGNGTVAPAPLDFTGPGVIRSLVTDSTNLVSNYSDTYRGSLRTMVRVVSAKTISITATHDDAGAIYVDGTRVYNQGGYVSGAQISFPLTAGWHMIELTWSEQGGGDGWNNITPTFSSLVDELAAPSGASSAQWDAAQVQAAAAVDAQTRATQAKADAEAAAALDASAKADAAQMTAIQAQAYSLNPSFEDWTGTIPANYTTFVTNPTKETTTVRTGKNAVRFNCTDNTTQRGLQFNAALAHAPYFEYLTVELDVRLDSGSSFGGSGVLVDWTGMTGGNRATISLASEIPAPVTGRWYRVTKVIRKPATATGTFSSYSAWLMGQYSAGMGAMAVKNVIFDWINVRPATTEEITAYGTPASITALSDTVNTKTKSWFQTDPPPLTGNTTGDLWFDTNDGNKIYIWNGAWTVAQDQAIFAVQPAVTTAITAAANGKNKVVYSTSAASGTGYIAGDTWFQRDGSNNIIGQWEFTTSWQARQIDNAVIANLNAAKINAGTIAADRIGAGTINASKIFVGDMTNLAADGNFVDTTKANWGGSGTIITTAGEPNKLRVVTASSGNNDQPNNNLIQVVPGEQIYVSGWVYGEPANVGGGGPNIHLIVQMNDGVVQWPAFDSKTRAAVSGVWTELKGTVTIPSNAKFGRVELAVSYAADAVGNIYYFRNITARRKATGELIVNGAIKANSAIIEEGAIGNAHIGNLAVNTAEIADLAVTNAKIEDLAVTNAKIANATIQAAKIGSVDAGTITVGQLSAAQIAATAIDGKTITGATVQTETTVNRGIKLTSAELAGYDGAGAKNFSLTSTGTLTVRGAIQSGSTIEGATITGTTGIQTSGTAQRGVKITNTGVSAFDGSGNMTFKVDGATGIVEAPGIKANSITGDKIAAKTILADSLVLGGLSNLFDDGPFASKNVNHWEVNGTPAAVVFTEDTLSFNRSGASVIRLIGRKWEPVQAGEKFLISVPTISSAATGTYDLYTYMLNDAGTQTNSLLVSGLTVVGPHTGEWTVPAGTVAIKPYLYMSTDVPAGSSIKIGRPQVIRKVVGSLIVDGAIDGKAITGATITGGLIQSEVTANRGIKLTSSELSGYDGAGVKNFALTSAGALTIRGTIESGSTIKGATLAAAGGGIETTTTAARGVKLKDTGIITYDSSGNMTFKVDAATGLVEAPGLKANSITGDMIAGQTVRASNLFVGDFNNLATIDELNGTTIASFGQTQIVSGYNKLVTDSGTYLMFTEKRGPVPFAVGDTLYYEFTAKATSATTVQFGAWSYDAADANLTTVSPALNIGTTDTLIKEQMVLTSVKPNAVKFTVGLNGVANKGIQVKGVKVYKKYAGSLIVDGAIDGKVITGATIQTVATVDRGIKLTSTELAGYDGAGVKNFSLASDGTLAVRGTIKAGSSIEGATITGTTGVQTNTGATTGVKMTNTGIVAYDGGGNMSFKVDATTGEVEAPGIKANSIKGDKIEGKTITADKMLISGANLLTDPGFQDASGWSLDTGVTVSSTGGRTGGGTITIPTSSAQRGGYYGVTTAAKRFAVKSGGFYRVSAWVRSSVTIPVAGASMWFRSYNVDNTMAFATPSSIWNTATIPANTWTEISGTFEIPAGYTQGAVGFYKEASFTTGSVTFSDPFAQQSASAELIVDGAITTEHMTAGTIDGSVISAGTLTATEIKGKSVSIDKLLITSTDNLIQEGDFSAEGASWQLPANFVVNATASRKSLPALVITNTAALQTSYNSVGAPVKTPIEFQSDGGNSYRMDAWVRSTVSVPVSAAFMSARFTSTSGSTTEKIAIYSTSVSSSSTPPSAWETPQVIPADTWTQISGMVTAPLGTTSVAFAVNSAATLSTGTLTWDSVSVTRGTNGKLVVDGSITADKLEVDLVLATRIIAGDPDGTHAEMSPQGFRVFADAVEPGAPSTEVVRLGVADTNDYFAVTKANGTLAATISQDGTGAFGQVYANEGLYYKGVELTDFINTGRLVARAYRNTSSAFNAANGVTQPYVRLDRVPLKAGNLYRVSTGPVRMDHDANTLGYTTIWYKFSSTDSNVQANAGAGSASIAETVSDAPPVRTSDATMGLIAPTEDGWGSFLFSFTSQGPGQVGLRSSTSAPFRMLVEDLGKDVGTSGIYMDGTNPPPPAVNNYQKKYYATQNMNYKGDNTQYNWDLGHAYQGWSPAGYGNLKSIQVMQNMTSDLSGANINWMRMYWNFPHWYYNSGGTARIGVHGHTSVPSTYSGTTIIHTSGGWPKPGAKWVDIPSAYWGGFASGAYRGLLLDGVGADYQYYGYADMPVIEINYTK